MTNQINHAIEDQTRSQDNLRENLYPTQEQCQQSIAESERVIEELNTRNQVIDKQRAEEHAEYEQRMADAEHGIQLMNECIEVVNEHLLGGGSFVQLSAAKKETFNKAEKFLKNTNNKEFKLAIALASLATNS